MLDWLVVIIAVQVLVILAVYLIVDRRYRGQIASRDAEIAALNAALNERAGRGTTDASARTALLVAAICLAAIVYYLPIHFPSPPPPPPPPAPLNSGPQSLQTSASEQSNKPQQNIVEGALGQLRMIMERLKLTIVEQWKLTGTSAFDTPNKLHQSSKPGLMYRSYYSCCCAPNYYHRHYDYYR